MENANGKKELVTDRRREYKEEEWREWECVYNWKIKKENTEKEDICSFAAEVKEELLCPSGCYVSKEGNKDRCSFTAVNKMDHQECKGLWLFTVEDKKKNNGE